MKRPILLFILLMYFQFTDARAQQISSSLYKGTIDNQNVTLYLNAQENPCGGNDQLFMGIYRYGDQGKWIQLTVISDQKANFSLTEHHFTGTMVLHKTENGMKGIWISPDAKRQLKVKLAIQTLSSSMKEKMEEALEQTNYSNNDC